MPREWQETAWKTWTVKTIARVYRGKRPRCWYCDQERRDYLKNLDRNREKARNTLRSHARRYSERWECSRAEARRRLVSYGWDVDVIAQMFDDAKKSGLCRECKWEYDYGEHEMTLDVNDPEALPLLDSNTSVMCRTCNTAKQRLTLTRWRERQSYVRAILGARISRQLSLDEEIR